MNKKKYDLLGVGNAIVDIVTYKQEAFLEANNLAKGSMTLIDLETATKLHEKIRAATEVSGGSAANTIAGFALLGGNGAFHGTVKEDYMGKVFKKEIEKSKVSYLTDFNESGTSTAKCLIFVTEEESGSGKKITERTMATYLDFDNIIDDKKIDEQDIINSKIVYFEGYLFDTDSGIGAIEKCLKVAKENDITIAFTLSDSFCIDRHKEKFLDIIENYADIVFGNEQEFLSLFDEQDIRKALHKMLGKDKIFCVTRGELGSYIIKDEKVFDIEADKVEDIYDVTGAGDLYASGFLYGYTQRWGMEKCGKLASLCAADVIKQIGGRPIYNISHLLERI